MSAGHAVTGRHVMAGGADESARGRSRGRPRRRGRIYGAGGNLPPPAVLSPPARASDDPVPSTQPIQTNSKPQPDLEEAALAMRRLESHVRQLAPLEASAAR